MESEVTRYILEEVKDVKMRLEALSEKINRIEKDIVDNVVKIKYNNGKFEDVMDRIDNLEKFSMDAKLVLSRFDDKLLNDLVSINKTSGRWNRITDTIVASVISGVMVAVITGMFLYLNK